MLLLIISSGIIDSMNKIDKAHTNYQAWKAVIKTTVEAYNEAREACAQSLGYESLIAFIDLVSTDQSSAVNEQWNTFLRTTKPWEDAVYAVYVLFDAAAADIHKAENEH